MKIRIQTRTLRMFGRAAVGAVALLALTAPLLAFAVSPEYTQAASPASVGFSQDTIGGAVQSTSTQAAPMPVPQICCYKWFGCWPC
jgi:hypothetical protein